MKNYILILLSAFLFISADQIYAQAISVGVVNGKAVSLPQPENPENLSGAVSVRVEIDEHGNVISARAVSGDQALRSASEDAARRAKFKQTFMSGKAVPVSGVVVFNFAGSSKKSASTPVYASKEPAITKAKLLGVLRELSRKSANEEDRREKEQLSKFLPAYIEKYEVDFRLNAETEKELRAAGANDSIIYAVRKSFRGGSFGSSDNNLAASKANPVFSKSLNSSGQPPVGNYLCYYYGYNYALTSSSLTEISIYTGQQMKIVGETITFNYDGSVLTLLAGKFKGATAHYKLDSDNKPAIVFKRKENEEKGHKIDISDTWCYLDQ